jgi:hypothetical protein
MPDVPDQSDGVDEDHAGEIEARELARPWQREEQRIGIDGARRTRVTESSQLPFLEKPTLAAWRKLLCPISDSRYASPAHASTSRAGSGWRLETPN